MKWQLFVVDSVTTCSTFSSCWRQKLFSHPVSLLYHATLWVTHSPPVILVSQSLIVTVFLEWSSWKIHLCSRRRWPSPCLGHSEQPRCLPWLSGSVLLSPHLSQLTLITVCSSSGHSTLVSLPVCVCQVSAAPVWPVWPGCRIWNQISPARLVTLPGYHWLSQSRDTHCNQIFTITLALSTLDQCLNHCQLVLGYQL